MPSSAQDIILVGHTVHGLRRELIARKAFGHGKYDPPVIIHKKHIVSEAARITQDIVDGLPLGHEARDRISCHIGSGPGVTCTKEFLAVRKKIAPQLGISITPRALATKT